MSSFLIVLLFLGYTMVQYAVITEWILREQETSLNRTVKEVNGYIRQQDTINAEAIRASEPFLQQVIQQNQFIRIIDGKEQTVLFVSRSVPDSWIPPRSVRSNTTENFRRGDDHLLVARSPLQAAGFSGTVEVASNLETVDQLQNRLKMLVVVCLSVGIVISAAGGIFLARQMVGPIKRMAATMNKIKLRGVHERVASVGNGDEISRLAVIFNEMMDELEKSFHQQRAFIENASHELRTPVAIIEGHLRLLHRWGKSDPRLLQESLDAAMQETHRLKELVDQLLDLSRLTDQRIPADERQVNLSAVLDSLIRNYRVLHPEASFNRQVPETMSVYMNPLHLEQILIILTDNAIRYSGIDKIVTYTGRLDNGHAEIAVRDNGEGIPSEDIPYLFQRFYRVDKARTRSLGGNGLGLSIAKGLAEAYEGDIAIESTLGVGTTVRIRIPARE
ncbi:sensor histidine kinase [Paenibacillus darwinianus]|uniref:sensor histidine kinase n=1 Tax=Paenibacillus darwinianus TaxID=1380763 RepID=UPI000AFDC408|nr:HAMP domain-containing histidine kinase [Paenibacillus darwinianus]